MRPHPESVKEQARKMRAEGVGCTEIAASLGVGYSTVYRWLNPEYAERQRATSRACKERYRGICIDCGAQTAWCSGSHNNPAERCQPCRKVLERASKIWTREVVIDAIQRFAAVRGRPPHASDWIAADPANGYPPNSSVHKGGSSNPTAPFDKWADAIEAAGFPRPRVGGYERTALVRERASASMIRAKAAA